jgi:medium-chain acyl-[acyl-carrier-protein] hydrolase
MIMDSGEGMWIDFGALKKSSAEIVLFCFPYAGGAASIYSAWQQYFDSSVCICPVRLPGRERRIREPLIKDIGNLLEQAESNLTPAFERRYAFFGHSMGALIAHQLTLRLAMHGKRLPELLFLYARPAARKWIPDTWNSIVDSSDEEFLKLLNELDPNTMDIMKDETSRAFFLPILRADFELCASWKNTSSQPIDLPILGLYGNHDRTSSEETMVEWKSATTKRFDLFEIDGGHFFINSNRETVIEIVRDELSKLIGKL